MITTTQLPCRIDTRATLKEGCESNPRLRSVSSIICDAAEDMALQTAIVALFNEIKLKEKEVQDTVTSYEESIGELVAQLNEMKSANAELQEEVVHLRSTKKKITASLRRHISNQRAVNQAKLEPLEDLWTFASGLSQSIDDLSDLE